MEQDFSPKINPIQYHAPKNKNKNRNRNNIFPTEGNVKTNKAFFKYIDGKLIKADFTRKHGKNGVLKIFDAHTKDGIQWSVEIKITRSDGTFHIHRKNVTGSQLNKFIKLTDDFINKKNNISNLTDLSKLNIIRNKYKNYNGRPTGSQLAALHNRIELEKLAHELGLTISHKGRTLTKTELSNKIAQFIKTGKMTNYEMTKSKTQSKTQSKTPSKTQSKSKSKQKISNSGILMQELSI